MSPYQDRIKSLAPDHDPVQVECFMRLEYSTLDHLSAAKFREEVHISCACIDEDPEAAKELAKSYGF